MRPARILVVDDEPGLLRAVERVLSESHHVIGTRLSRDALSVANEFRPELAIIDIRMPDLNGFDLMTQLKARFPALDVILMTGSVDDLDEKLVRAIRSAAFYFIQKPFDREVLRTLVERCVELRRRREDHRQNLKRLETELAEARAFQQSLLPERETIVNRVAVSCRYTPCSALGGDLYDYAAAAGGADRAADRRCVGPRGVGGNAHGHRQERVPRVACRRLRAVRRGAAGFDGTRGLQPRSIRHPGGGTDLSRRTSAAVCECRSSADRSVATRERAAVAGKHRAAGFAGADPLDVGLTARAD